jgi:hypothetical protein
MESQVQVQHKWQAQEYPTPPPYPAPPPGSPPTELFNEPSEEVTLLTKMYEDAIEEGAPKKRLDLLLKSLAWAVHEWSGEDVWDMMPPAPPEPPTPEELCTDHSASHREEWEEGESSHPSGDHMWCDVDMSLLMVPGSKSYAEEKTRVLAYGAVLSSMAAPDCNSNAEKGLLNSGDSPPELVSDVSDEEDEEVWFWQGPKFQVPAGILYQDGKLTPEGELLMQEDMLCKHGLDKKTCSGYPDDHYADFMQDDVHCSNWDRGETLKKFQAAVAEELDKQRLDFHGYIKIKGGPTDKLPKQIMPCYVINCSKSERVKRSDHLVEALEKIKAAYTGDPPPPPPPASHPLQESDEEGSGVPAPSPPEPPIGWAPTKRAGASSGPSSWSSPEGHKVLTTLKLDIHRAQHHNEGLRQQMTSMLDMLLEDSYETGFSAGLGTLLAPSLNVQGSKPPVHLNYDSDFENEELAPGGASHFQMLPENDMLDQEKNRGAGMQTKLNGVQSTLATMGKEGMLKMVDTLSTTKVMPKEASAQMLSLLQDMLDCSDEGGDRRCGAVRDPSHLICHKHWQEVAALPDRFYNQVAYNRHQERKEDMEEERFLDEQACKEERGQETERTCRLQFALQMEQEGHVSTRLLRHVAEDAVKWPQVELRKYKFGLTTAPMHTATLEHLGQVDDTNPFTPGSKTAAEYHDILTKLLAAEAKSKPGQGPRPCRPGPDMPPGRPKPPQQPPKEEEEPDGMPAFPIQPEQDVKTRIALAMATRAQKIQEQQQLAAQEARQQAQRAAQQQLDAQQHEEECTMMDGSEVPMAFAM